MDGTNNVVVVDVVREVVSCKRERSDEHDKCVFCTRVSGAPSSMPVATAPMGPGMCSAMCKISWPMWLLIAWST